MATGATAVIPIFRMFDWDKAQEFYVGYLGWTVDWSHRFDQDAPLYVQVSGPGGVRLHLSEHHGDSTPGSSAIIEVADVEQVHAALSAKDYRYARPGIETVPWGRTVQVCDPFGNRLTFHESTGDETITSS